MMNAADETVDLKDLAAALRRGWIWLVVGASAGLLLGLILQQTLPSQYRASASVLLRGQTESMSPTLARLGGLSEVFGRGSAFETELSILTSRSVLGDIVDSLALQARVVQPRGIPLGSVVSQARFERHLPEADYRFRREDDGFRVTGPGIDRHVRPGGRLEVPGAVLDLAGSGLPDVFRLRLRDHEAALEWTERRLSSGQRGGDVASLAFRGDDPVMASAVPNAMITRYLERRQTVDRGVNQHRYEFLLRHADSIAVELASAESRLREYQERTGFFDAEVIGRAEFERVAELQAEIEGIDAERGALQRLLARPPAEEQLPRDVAAYPTLLRTPAINDLISQLSTLEVELVGLRDRRTDDDPDVQTLTRQISHLDGQLVALSRGYLTGLSNQRSELLSDLQRYRASLERLPERASESLRLERETRRLSRTFVELQTQLVEARLASIAEGGDIRQIDIAQPPRKRSFPNTAMLLGGGFFGGLFFAVAGVLGTAARGRWVVSARQAERLVGGVPVAVFRDHAPLMIGPIETGSVLVIPVGLDAEATQIAERLASTAALRAPGVALADFAGSSSAIEGLWVTDPALDTATPELSIHRFSGNGDRTAPFVIAELAELEQRYAQVFAALPPLDSPASIRLLSPRRAAVLVARAGRASPEELRSAREMLDSIGVHLLGVVLQPDHRVRRAGRGLLRRGPGDA